MAVTSHRRAASGCILAMLFFVPVAVQAQQDTTPPVLLSLVVDRTQIDTSLSKDCTIDRGGSGREDDTCVVRPE